MLPDGTIPIICVTDPSDPGKGQHPLRHIFGASCDACRISSAIICPAPLAVSDAFLQIETAFNFIPAAPILYRVAYPPAAPPQAPPLA
ncbi:hypothetical protein G3A39_43110 [Paraburkholderia aspalathi]|nr:hypothetical protein [Paraburkholderia aspalathi]